MPPVTAVPSEVENVTTTADWLGFDSVTTNSLMPPSVTSAASAIDTTSGSSLSKMLPVPVSSPATVEIVAFVADARTTV